MEQTKQAQEKLAIYCDSRLWFDALAVQLPYACLHATSPAQLEQLAGEVTRILALNKACPPLPRPVLMLSKMEGTLPIRLEPLIRALARMSVATDLEGFDPATGELDYDGRQTRLTEKEREVLTLLNSRQEAVSREALLADIWRYDRSADTHTVETHLYRLRTKLEEVYRGFIAIQTLPEGYRLIRQG